MSGGRILSWAMVAALGWMPVNWAISWIRGEARPDAELTSLALGTLACWGFAAGLAYFLVVSARGIRMAKERRAIAAGATSASTAFPHQKPTAFHWQDNGNFAFEVVGESFYQPELNALVPSSNGEWIAIYHIATLLPEDNNPHDDKAVSVHIQGKQVGHLSRDDARSFRRRLSAKKITGLATTCPAVIRGGGVIGNEKALYGVRLDMKPFD
jgi:hypothetical protein